MSSKKKNKHTGSKFSTIYRASKKSKKKPVETGKRTIAQAARRATEAAMRQHPEHLRPGAKPAPKEGTRAFKALQTAWYKKLAKSEADKVARAPAGKLKEAAEAAQFIDLEWQGNPESPYIRRPASRARKLTPGKQLYFAMARNFLTHFRFRHMWQKTAWTLHTDGASYRQIHEALKKQHNCTKSIFWVFYSVKELSEKCRAWNNEHADGLLNNAGASFADDALLADPRLDECYSDASEYGMPIDAGFWQSVPRPKG